MTTNILVTGANGFIGKKIVQSLRTNNSFNVKQVMRLHQLSKHTSTDDMFYIPELTSNTNWQEALQNCQVIIHTAGRAHQIHDQAKDPLLEFRKINVEGSVNLANQAAKAGVKRFIFISSIGVNGLETSTQPFNETLSPNPITHYAISKYEAEIRLQEIAQQTNMDVVIIRPPLVYGASAPGNFHQLLDYVSRGIFLPFASLKNKKSFISRENLVDFIQLCITHPLAKNETFVISDGEDISTPRLIELLAQGMEKNAKLFPLPLPLIKIGCTLINKQASYQQLCSNLQIDMQKATKLLDWTPPVPVTKGLMQAGKEFIVS